MDKISSLIPKVLNKRGLKDQANASYIVFLATEWVAEQLSAVAAETRIVSVEDGTLYVETEHPAVSQELTAQKEALLMYLNGFEGIAISDVRIQRKK